MNDHPPRAAAPARPPATPQGRRTATLAGALAGALAIALAIAAINVIAWQLLHRQFDAPAHGTLLGGLAYNSSNRWHDPATGQRPAPADVEADLALLSRHTNRIRSYSATEDPQLPAVAHRHGLQLMLGAWLDERLDANQREIAAAIAQARAHANVHRLIVGNETQLKARLPPNRLAAYLDQVRTALRGTGVQVSTAEPWHVWLSQPQLARHVDFIAIHVLPFWERESIDDAVQTSLRHIDRVQARFPGQRVVVAEIGWPSNGSRAGQAVPSAAHQALFVRRFLQEAQARGLDYYLIEAFDQPWKVASEGRAGAYWGLWDAHRQPKFDWSGPVLADPAASRKAWLASGLGAVAIWLLLLAAPRMRLAGRLAFAAATQAVISLAVVLLSIPLSHYLTAADGVGLVVVVAALAFIVATVLAQAFEFADRFWPARPADPAPAQGDTSAAAPFVSIHLACANEPPSMVTASVDALLALDWPAFEVIVVDNNTADPQARAALAAAMAARRDPRLRFAQWAELPGYKAGALNQALALTDAAAEWIAVVDADYVVDPSWLRQLHDRLLDPAVGLVQAPQAHRQVSAQPMARMMNWEMEGFFRIGMHHRNERNAIIQHGTMCLMRAAALRRLRWNEDCLCEDTELGLRLLREGWRAVYVDRVLGSGLLPRDFAAYGRQRKRWAQGAMQILRRLAALAGRCAAPALHLRDACLQPGHGVPAQPDRCAAVAVRAAADRLLRRPAADRSAAVHTLRAVQPGRAPRRRAGRHGPVAPHRPRRAARPARPPRGVRGHGESIGPGDQPRDRGPACQGGRARSGCRDARSALRAGNRRGVCAADRPALLHLPAGHRA
jgi:exo-beta-1,3-glucanase (GH17 family)